jgi:hypothetical protein
MPGRFDLQFRVAAGNRGPRTKFCHHGAAAVRIDPRAETARGGTRRAPRREPARVLIAAESAGRRELLLDLLRARAAFKPRCSTISPPSSAPAKNLG